MFVSGFRFSLLLFACRRFLGKTSSGQGSPNWIQKETKPQRTEHGMANFQPSGFCVRRRVELPVDRDSVKQFHTFQSY